MEKVEISLEHYHHFQKIEKEYEELVNNLIKQEGTIFFSNGNSYRPTSYYAVNPDQAIKDIEFERELLLNKLHSANDNTAYYKQKYQDQTKRLDELCHQKMPTLNLSGKKVKHLAFVKAMKAI